MLAQAVNEINKSIIGDQGQATAAESRNLTGEGCSRCGHLTLQLAASERRAGLLARSLDELQEQLALPAA